MWEVIIISSIKTIIVEHLKMTDEAYTIDMGTNATQTFGFRSTNDLYVVKGDVHIEHINREYKISFSLCKKEHFER